MSGSYSTTAVKCRWRFDCLWSGICSRLRAGQTNLSKTLTSELLPEVPLSGDQANDMLNLSVQNKQKSVHPPWGGHLKAQDLLCWVRWRPCLCTWRLWGIWGELWDPINQLAFSIPVWWFQNPSFLKDRALLLQDDAQSDFREAQKIKGGKE